MTAEQGALLIEGLKLALFLLGGILGALAADT